MKQVSWMHVMSALRKKRKHFQQQKVNNVVHKMLTKRPCDFSPKNFLILLQNKDNQNDDSGSDVCSAKRKKYTKFKNLAAQGFVKETKFYVSDKRRTLHKTKSWHSSEPEIQLLR